MKFDVLKMKLGPSSQLFKVLGNQLRLDVLQYLRNGEKCVCDIFEHLDRPQNLVSHHLAMLRKNNFIKARKDGKWVYYSLNPEQISSLHSFLESFLSPKNNRITPKC